MKRYLFELTPLGKADKEVRDFLKENLDEAQFTVYTNALKHYRHMKLIQTGLKLFLYASIVTAFAATFGIQEAELLQKAASYIGTSLIFALYAITSYITMIRRETYHVQREILIAKAVHQPLE